MKSTSLPCEAPQHDDHIWMNLGGESWAISYMRWPLIYFWRGYASDLEYCAIDMTEFRPYDYYKRWYEMTYGEEKCASD